MKKLHAIHLDRLKDAQFIEFTQNTLRILQELKGELGLTPLSESYAKAQALLEEGFRKQKTTLHTQELNKKDKDRHDLYMSILHQTKGIFRYEKDAAQHSAAEKILHFFKLYQVGGSKFLDQNAESAAITHLLRDLKAQAAAETALLKLTEKLGDLEKAQADFEKIYAERGDLVAENKALFEFKQARSFASSVFSALRKHISILPISFPDKSKEIEALVDRLDAEIVKYAALIKKNKEEDFGVISF